VAETLLVVGVRGLGRFLALHFAAAGWNVVCASRTQADLDALAAEVRAAQPHGLGLSALGLACDLRDAASLEQLCAQAWDRFGSVELAVAAQTSGAPFAVRPVLETPPEDVGKGFEGYPLGTLRLLRALGPRLVQQKRGTFVQIGTGGGFKLRDGMAGLAAPQHALRVLVEAAGREWKPFGVHCAYLAVEGQLDTPKSAGYIARNGLERTVPCAEVARALEFLHRQDPRSFSHELSLRPAAAP
jgi:NAD(P)-dependent dehydrogenase (short-subunit alcohol dehydrogenase family)